MHQLYDNSDDLSSPELKSAAYYAIIPANVRYHQQLSANAKLLYGEISALTTREGYCFASNQYFADLYQVTPRSIIRMVGQLESCGFIRTEEERDPATGRVRGRRIYLAVSAPGEHPGDKKVTPAGQNCQGEGDNFVTPLLIINNNKDINRAGNGNAEKPDAVRAQFASWVQTQADAWPEQATAKLLDAFAGFQDERKRNKKPLRSARAVTLLCNRLAEYSGGNPAAMADMLDEATLKGWQSVYPPDAGKSSSGRQKAAREDDGEWL